MAYKKKTYKKKRTFLRKYKKRIPRGPSIPKTYNYCLKVDGSEIVSVSQRTYSQNSGLSHASMYFTLNDLPQVTAFTGLYDQYKITKVKVSFIPMVTQNAVISTAAEVSNPGLFGTVIDYDDNNALTTFAQYEEYQNFKFQPCISTKTMTRTFRPHIAIAAYQSSFAGFGNKANMWLDCASPTIQHYGLKFYADPYASTLVPQTWQIMATYWLSFRNVR